MNNIKGKGLLIAEKNSLMSAIRDVYKKNSALQSALNLEFEAFAGHVMVLDNADGYDPAYKEWKYEHLPIFPEKFKFVVSKGKEDLYKKISQKIQSGGYDYIINACDAGREGEHIFWAYYDTAGFKKPVYRFWANDVSVEGITKALANLRTPDDEYLKNLKNAAKLRAAGDWLMGINLTRGISKIYGYTIKVGRVQTPVMKIVADREVEIKNFKIEEYLVGIGEFKTASGDLYNGIIVNEEGENVRFKTEEEFKAASDEISKLSEGQAVSVEKENKRKAPLLHSLSTLQSEANVSYGFTMAETLSLAQTLYEKGIISYPRTESSYLTKTTALELDKVLPKLKGLSFIEPYISEITDKDLSSKVARIANDKTYTDDSKVQDHYAIIPTGVSGKMSDKESKLYEIICKKLVSVFLPPLITKKVKITTTVGDFIFSSDGGYVVQEGYSVLYKKIGDKPLPALASGINPVEVCSLVSDMRKTVPPKRFTDASLNNIMENVDRLVEDKNLKKTLKSKKGIGTPATRAGIVEKLVESTLISRNKGQFHASDEAIELVSKLSNLSIISPSMTGDWEMILGDIEKGTAKNRSFLDKMRTDLASSMEELDRLKAVITPARKSSSGGFTVNTWKCPCCGGTFKELKTFYGCENRCFTIGKVICDSNITIKDVDAITSGKKTALKTFTFKNGSKIGKAKLVFNKDKKKVEFTDFK